MCIFLLLLGMLFFSAALPLRSEQEPPAAVGVLPCLQTAIDALAARGIAIDSNAACRAAALAVARSIDPRAELWDLAREASPPAPTVEKAEMWTEEVGYLKLRGLEADTATNVEERVSLWLRGTCSGLILDLRAAAGDNLAAVDRLTAFFTGETGSLYVVRNSRGPAEPHSGVSSSRWQAAAPLIVLTDRDTRDGSELLAALLRGRSGVMLIGDFTRGDARVREVVPWGDHDGFWIATGRVELQRGPAYDPGGVVPDVLIKANTGASLQEKIPAETVTGRPLSARARQDRTLLLRTAGDAVLCRTVEILFALKAVRMETKR